jgi:hypothetical protein
VECHSQTICSQFPPTETISSSLRREGFPSLSQAKLVQDISARQSRSILQACSIQPSSCSQRPMGRTGHGRIVQTADRHYEERPVRRFRRLINPSSHLRCRGRLHGLCTMASLWRTKPSPRAITRSYPFALPFVMSKRPNNLTFDGRVWANRFPRSHSSPSSYNKRYMWQKFLSRLR